MSAIRSDDANISDAEAEASITSTIEEFTAKIGDEAEDKSAALEESSETTVKPDPESETEEEEEETEETAESTEVEEKAEEETTEEEEPEELEEELTGRDLIRHLRKVHTKDAKLAREQEAQISQLQTPVEQASPVAPAAKADRIAPSDIFRGLAEVRAGERTEADLPVIDQNIENMTMTDLQGVIQTAKRNGFGAMSNDILELVKENIPTVLMNDNLRAGQSQAQDTWSKENAESWEDVKSIPGMEDSNSQIYKDFVKAESALIKKFPGIKLQADAPMQVVEHMEMTRKASKITKYSKLKKENDDLRKQLQQAQGGLTTTGNVSAAAPKGDKETTPEEDFLLAIGMT